VSTPDQDSNKNQVAPNGGYIIPASNEPQGTPIYGPAGSEPVSPYQTPEGEVKKKKSWGLGSFSLAFAAFLLLQVVIAFGIIIFGVIQYGTEITPEQILDLTTAPAVLLISSLSMYVVWVASMYVVSRVRGEKSFKKDFWVYFKKYDVFIGLGIAVGMIILASVINWLLADILGLDMKGSDNGAVFTSLNGIWLILIAGGIASILGPISEELFFRGFFMQAVRKTGENLLNYSKRTNKGVKLYSWLYEKRNWFAVILSSIGFGLMHFQGIETFGQIFVMLFTGSLGVVFALVALKTRRLGPVIFAHMFYNGLTLVLALVTQ
jgi:membrane protease YdiL (CAAX protease family)